MKPWHTPAEDDLRLLLNEWDPIGVAGDMQAEYDCVIAPLLSGSVPGPARPRSVSSCGTSWEITSVSTLWGCGRTQ